MKSNSARSMSAKRKDTDDKVEKATNETRHKRASVNQYADTPTTNDDDDDDIDHQDQMHFMECFEHNFKLVDDFVEKATSSLDSTVENGRVFYTNLGYIMEKRVNRILTADDASSCGLREQRSLSEQRCLDLCRHLRRTWTDLRQLTLRLDEDDDDHDDDDDRV